MAGAVVRGVVVCPALVLYGRVHYPAESAGGAYIAVFVPFVAASVWMAFCGDGAANVARRLPGRYGAAGGAAVGALFGLVATRLAHARYAAFLAVGCAVAATTLAARASGDPRTAVLADLWVVAVSGLVFFVGLMTLTYRVAGWFTHHARAVPVFNHFGPGIEHGYRFAQWPGFVGFVVPRESAVATPFGFVAAPRSAPGSAALGGLLGARHGRDRLSEALHVGVA